MLKLSKRQGLATELKVQDRYIDKNADKIVGVVLEKCPDISPPLIRVSFRMLVSSLQRHGVTDIFTACDLSSKYFTVGEVMASDPWSNRWRQILINMDMTEESKVKELARLLSSAERSSL